MPRAWARLVYHLHYHYRATAPLPPRNSDLTDKGKNFPDFGSRPQTDLPSTECSTSKCKMAGPVAVLRARKRIPNTTQQSQYAPNVWHSQLITPGETALDATCLVRESHLPSDLLSAVGAGTGRPQAERIGTLPESTPVLGGGGGHRAEGVRDFLIYDHRTPSHPINLGSVSPKP